MTYNVSMGTLNPTIPLYCYKFFVFFVSFLLACVSVGYGIQFVHKRPQVLSRGATTPSYNTMGHPSGA